MDQDINILDLPDLALHKICTYISDPFDLLHFGNTCSHLRSISSSPSLWWPIAFRWCEGMWIFINFHFDHDHPKEWLLELFRRITIRSTGTESKCVFANGEIWERIESPRLRCIFGMMHLAYPKRRAEHPAVLFEQWLYDIGLYRRVNAQINFALDNFEFSEDHINVLSRLGQAAERDLRRRKQPNKDPKYYIKRVGTVQSNWKSELFPHGLYSTTCPLLMCPFENALTNETTGLQGLSVSLSIVLAKLVKIVNNKPPYLHIDKVLTFIKTFCTLFQQEVMNSLPQLGPELKPRVLSVINSSSFNTELLQKVLAIYKINFSCRDIINEFTKFVSQYEGIDYMVDKVRSQIREATFDEINQVLFKNAFNNCSVTRINLTDSDLIGGDNSKQEMSSAAFISDYGVLVTWHLTGRMRF